MKKLKRRFFSLLAITLSIQCPILAMTAFDVPLEMITPNDTFDVYHLSEGMFLESIEAIVDPASPIAPKGPIAPTRPFAPKGPIGPIGPTMFTKFDSSMSGRKSIAMKSLSEKSKYDKQTFKVDPASRMKIENRHGPIDVRSTNDAEATIEATIKVTGDSDIEIQKVLDQFSLEVSTNSGYIEVKPNFNYEYWKIINSWLRSVNEIKFADGTTAQDIDDIVIELIAYQPKVNELILETKCNDITFDEIQNDVSVKLFSADFKGGDIKGDLDLDIKYGETAIGNFKSGKVTIFDGEFAAGDAEDISIETKYSELQLNNLKSLEMTSFDDEVQVGNINDECDITAKYSEFTMSNFGKVELDFFECDFEGGNGSELAVESKYSDIDLGNFATLDFEGFDDELDVGNLQIFKSSEAKYCEIEIESIEKRLSINEAFDGQFKVGRILDNFESVGVTGKYTDFYLPLPSGIPYYLTARLQYGDLIFDGDCSKQKEHSGSDVTTLDCEMGEPNSNSPTVNIASFSSNVYLK